MTTAEAKTILSIYRPDSADADDPQFAEALALARQEPALADWFARHCTAHRSLQKSLRELPVPHALLENILADRRILKPKFSPRLALALAAAAVLLLAALSLFQPPSWTGHRFENFRSRMVSGALRSYEMDIVTNRHDIVRAFLRSRGAPADYRVPEKLDSLSLTGGGVLSWRNHPVSMICYDRGNGQMLFLFVINRSAMPNPPAQTARTARENKMLTLSWSEGDRTYLLAGPEEPDFERKYR